MSSQLSPLDEAGVQAAVAQALSAFAAATTLEELKAARLAHSGDNAPITHANMQIRNLAKEEKPIAGKLLGAARKDIQAALASATARIEEAEAAAALATETVDVTVPTNRSPRGGAIRSRFSVRILPTSSLPWAGRSPKAPKWNTNGLTSTP